MSNNRQSSLQQGGLRAHVNVYTWKANRLRASENHCVSQWRYLHKMYKSGKMQGSDSQVDCTIGVQDSVQEVSAFH